MTDLHPASGDLREALRVLRQQLSLWMKGGLASSIDITAMGWTALTASDAESNCAARPFSTLARTPHEPSRCVKPISNPR